MTSLRRIAGSLMAAAIALASCQSPDASPTAEDALAGIVLGCGTIEPTACHRAASAALAFLPADAHPFDIQVVLNGCPNGGACPRTAEARKGSVVLEFEGGIEPITYFLAGPEPANEAVTGTFSGPISPRSPRVNGAGPFEFDLGHCGLLHGVDLDGSFWVPLGPFDGDADAAINSVSGTMRLLVANVAEFRGVDGFTARLARFPGEKHFFTCA